MLIDLHVIFEINFTILGLMRFSGTGVLNFLTKTGDNLYIGDPKRQKLIATSHLDEFCLPHVVDLCL